MCFNMHNGTESVPGDPQNVAVVTVNSTAVRVEWKPPVEKEQFGVIRGYQIHVQEIDSKVRLFTPHRNSVAQSVDDWVPYVKI